MIPNTNLTQLALNYKEKRKIDDITLKEIVNSISNGLVIKSDDNILDIGCGTGRILLPLSHKNPKSKFTGLDVSNDMIDSLKREIVKDKVKNVQTLRCDANNKLPFANCEFDSILLYHSYHIIKNKEYLSNEIRRILKSNGRLLVASTSHTQLATTLNYKYIPEMLAKEFKRTPDIAQIIKIFRKNNFKLVEMKEVIIKKKFDNLEDWINFLSTRPISALTFFDDKKLQEELKKMKNNLRKNFGDFVIEYGFDYHTQLYFQKYD